MNIVPPLYLPHENHPERAGDDVNPLSAWALEPDASVTIYRKWDGVPLLVDGAKIFQRVRLSASNAPLPKGLRTIAEGDDVTLGWLPIDLKIKPNQATANMIDAMRDSKGLPDGTYEMIGPNIKGGNEGLPLSLVPHGTDEIGDFNLANVNRATLFKLVESYDIEGIVLAGKDEEGETLTAQLTKAHVGATR